MAGSGFSGGQNKWIQQKRRRHFVGNQMRIGKRLISAKQPGTCPDCLAFSHSGLYLDNSGTRYLIKIK